AISNRAASSCVEGRQPMPRRALAAALRTDGSGSFKHATSGPAIPATPERARTRAATSRTSADVSHKALTSDLRAFGFLAFFSRARKATQRTCALLSCTLARILSVSRELVEPDRVS